MRSVLKRRGRILKIGILLVAVSIFSSGCLREPGQGQPGGDAPAVVTLWHSLQGGEAAALGDAVQNINASYPQVILQTKFVPEADFVAQAYYAEAGGQGPDIFIAKNDTLNQLYHKGTLAPVALPGTTSFPGLSARFQAGDVHYAEPWLTDIPVLYYRSDKVGVPKSLTELFDTQSGGLAVPALSTQYLSPWWSGQGGQLWHGSQPALDAPANANFLQQLLAWRETGKFLVTPDALNLFTQGQVNYYIGWASQALAFNTAQVPYGSLAPTDVAGGQGKSLSGAGIGIANSTIKTTPEKSSAIRLVEEVLVSPEVEGAFSRIGYYLPANTNYYTTEQAQQGVLPAANKSLKESWVLESNSLAWKLIPSQDAAWGNAFTGTMNIPDSLAQAQNEAIKITTAP